MAEERNTILIDVEVNTEDTAQKLGEVVKEISELRTEQKNLTKELQESDEVDAEKARRLAEVQSELRRLKNEQKEYTSILQNESAIANNYGDSLDEQRRKLSDMQKTYDSLSASWRDSSAGQAFKTQLDKQYDSVIELEKATGRHQRNVGNYPNVMGGAVKSFGNLDGAIAQVSDAFNGLSTNGIKGLGGLAGAIGNVGKIMLASPILALVGAIVVAFQKLSDAFKKNDEAGTNLDRAFSRLKPITQALGEYFDKLAVTVSNLILKFSEGAIAVGKFLNKIGLMKGNFEEAAKGAEELVIAEDNLDQAERDFAVNSAKRQRDIAELRAMAVDSEKYSAEERIKLYEEANELEQANLDEELKIAQERVRILKETAKQNVDTSDETANEIAKAEASLYKAEETYYTGTRRLQAQLVKAKKEIVSEEVAIAKERKKQAEKDQKEADERAKKEAEELAKKEKIKEEIMRTAKETAIALIEDESERARVIELDRFEQEKEDLLKKYEELGILTEEQELAKNELLENLKREHLARMEEIEDEAKLIALEKKAEEDEKKLEEELNKATSEEEKRMLELEQAQAHHDELVRMTQEEIDAKFTSQEEYEKAVKKSENNITDIQKKNALARTLQAKSTLEDIGQAVNAIGGFIDELDLKEEESAKAQKALALAQVAIQSGIAVATAVAECQKLGFPAAIPAVIVAVATIAANIASAVSTINGAKFADGGIVGGSSYAGDNVPIQVNSGEMVLNRNQQKNLFEIANTGQVSTGIDYDLLSMKISQAIQQMPAPVLVYEEFTNFQENVSQNIKYAEV